MNLFKSLTEIADILGCAVETCRPVENACVDTRLLQSNDLFFALKGEKSDGHQFLAQAAQKGASAAVVSAGYTGSAHGLMLLPVADPLEALQSLAAAAAQRMPAKIVGITGSLGKTTTKEFLYTILGQKFSVICTPGNYNSQIGLPLTLLNHVKGDEDIVILEMAMSKKGQIRKLCQIAPPDIAVVTCVALVHAENFESIEGIAAAKGEILLHPKTKLGIVPEDFPDFGSCEKRHAAKIEIPAAFPFPGTHHRYNFQVAAACALALGMNSAEILEAVPYLKLPDNRFQMVEKNGVLFINDAYNAATASVRAALESLPQPKGEGRRMAVLSGLFELGKFTEECHREVASISLNCLDRLYCLGEECRSIVDAWEEKGREARLCMNRQEIVEALKKTMVPGDVILLKGANKKQLWKVLEEIE